jgi:hypothetical protein
MNKRTYLFATYLCMGAVVVAMAASPVADEHGNWHTLQGEVHAAIDVSDWNLAYRLLSDNEMEFAGMAEFDRLIGQVAAQTGHITQAVLAYERVQAVEPDDVESKRQLAILHFRGGENGLSRQIFDELSMTSLTTDLNSESQRETQQFLRAIDERERPPEIGWREWGSMGWGYDSNVNAGTKLQQIDLTSTVGQTYTVNQTYQAVSSPVRQLQIGARWTGEAMHQNDMIRDCMPKAQLDIQDYDAMNATQFSKELYRADITLACKNAARTQESSVGLIRSHIDQDGSAWVDSTAMRLQHSWYSGSSSMLQLSGMHEMFAFAQTPSLNGPHDMVQVDAVNKLGSREQWLLGGSVIVNRLMPQASDAQTAGYHSVALQTSLRYHYDRHWSLSNQTSLEVKEFSTTDPNYLTIRHDDLIQTAFALNYRFNDQHQLSLNWLQQHNLSNQSLYQFDRTICMVNWRTAFGN